MKIANVWSKITHLLRTLSQLSVIQTIKQKVQFNKCHQTDHTHLLLHIDSARWIIPFNYPTTTENVFFIFLNVIGSSSSTVRLSGGNESAGRVEVFLNGQWGTVCDDYWDIQDATIVCRQIGFPGAVEALRNARFGQGQGLIHLDDVACNGQERSILDCPRSSSEDCGHSEDAAVVCLTGNLIYKFYDL